MVLPLYSALGRPLLGVLHPALRSLAQETHGPVRVNPEKGHRSVCAPQLWAATASSSM